MNSVPFTIGNLYAGLGECQGLLRREEEDICIDFQVKDAVVGVLKSEIQRLRFPIKEASVTLTKGWLGTSWLGVTLVVQAKQMNTLQDMPGMSQGRIELSIARKDYQAAEDFIADLHEPLRLI